MTHSAYKGSLSAHILDAHLNSYAEVNNHTQESDQQQRTEYELLSNRISATLALGKRRRDDTDMRLGFSSCHDILPAPVQLKAVHPDIEIDPWSSSSKKLKPNHPSSGSKKHGDTSATFLTVIGPRSDDPSSKSFSVDEAQNRKENLMLTSAQTPVVAQQYTINPIYTIAFAEGVKRKPRGIARTLLFETYHGFIEDAMDALLVVQATIMGRLKGFAGKTEDMAIVKVRSGSVIVMTDNRLGMKRWRDGIRWSPSRSYGPFLLYRQIEEADPNWPKVEEEPSNETLFGQIGCSTGLQSRFTGRP